MFSREQLRKIVNEKLAVAAEEILGLLEVKVEKYEEEISRQRRLLDVFLKPQLKLHRADFREKDAYMDKQDFTYNGCNAGLASDPPQNEEQLSRPQKEQQSDGMFFSTDEEHNHSDNDTLDLNRDNSLQKSLANMPGVNSDLSEPNLQLFSNSSYEAEVKGQKGDGQDVSGSTIQEAPNNLQYKDFQGQHVYKEEEEEVDISEQQWATDRNSGLGKEDTKSQQMKSEYVGNTEGEEQVVLKEADAFAFGPMGEKHSEDQSQHRNPGESLKRSVTKSSLSCVTRRVNSRSARQDKEKTPKQQQKGKGHTTNDQQPTKAKRRNSKKREKAFKCDTCGKMFNAKSNLRIHVRIHTGEKPYMCPTCGKCFTQQGHLCSHILIHTGERPHVCMICKKSFTRKKELCRHLQIHPGQHPYVCVTCGKGFIWKKDLVAHKRAHKVEKPHVCRTCGKVFKHKYALNSHMRIHKST